MIENSRYLMASLTAVAAQCELTREGNTYENDYGSCSVAGEVQIACTGAGGKYITDPTIHIVCIGNETKVDVILNDYPECMGKSCEGTMLDNDEFRSELETLLEGQLGASVPGVECKVSNTVPTSSLHQSSLASVVTLNNGAVV
eukprot:CAMPEP_0196156912 /NCGR_PEP_ID=MMETSP0910-20130528/43101_1 /TAXON_ID=49265 /ORGANISM="Thalassiosira rotula, Strain GSO102" /LENGTH=143 /DNA_ID=CAMNT_0041421473 /DNA_START=142 /DNA_END=569 /DNA_ORIENTATION=-